jgi:hypothetical protein
MPRLNYGTLLENIVVVESIRLGLEHTATEDVLGFATSFAMPPMTQCWCKVSEDAGNPCFNHAFLLRLGTRFNRPASLQAMWSLCMKNLPKLPVRPFHQTDGRLLFDSGGPNGALLASLLAVQSGRRILLWINDNAERYPRVPAAGADASVDELTAAGALLGTEPIGSATQIVGRFPAAISRLATWLEQGAGPATKIRIGFLDPDHYAEGDTQVSSFDHREWLRTLATGCSTVLSATFSGCQNRGQGNAKRNQRLVSLWPFIPSRWSSSTASSRPASRFDGPRTRALVSRPNCDDVSRRRGAIGIRTSVH